MYKCDTSNELMNIRSIVADIVRFITDNNRIVEDDILFEIKVILNELFQNALKHGNKGLAAKRISIKVWVTDRNSIVFVIEDEGEGFNYTCLSRDGFEPADLCDLKESGRGMLIVKNLCDRLTFNKKGNKVVVLKKI